MVLLEFKYLNEIKRITKTPDAIQTHLEKYLGITLCKKPLLEIIIQALNFNWTRDPFDRIITAHAAVNNDILLTKDKVIHNNYGHAIW